ncbi:hypothetical protein TNCV_1511251 [Trichonephila clavipes]|nr:hypothetical protein TNCV_1511251 [Trichonephila clavipes]
MGGGAPNIARSKEALFTKAKLLRGRRPYFVRVRCVSEKMNGCWMSLGNGTRSVPPSHIEFVDVALCGWACLRESVLIGGSNVASRRGYRIGVFLLYGFGGNILMLSIRPCCDWSMALRE